MADTPDPEHVMASLKAELARIPLLARQLEKARLTGKSKKVKALSAKILMIANESEALYVLLECLCGPEHTYVLDMKDLYIRAEEELRGVIARLELILATIHRD